MAGPNGTLRPGHSSWLRTQCPWSSRVSVSPPVKWAQEWAKRSSFWPWEPCAPAQGWLSLPMSKTALKAGAPHFPSPQHKPGMCHGSWRCHGAGTELCDFSGFPKYTLCHQNPFWVPGSACAKHFTNTICWRDLFTTNYATFSLKSSPDQDHIPAPPTRLHMVRMELVPSMFQPPGPSDCADSPRSLCMCSNFTFTVY